MAHKSLPLLVRGNPCSPTLGSSAVATRLISATPGSGIMGIYLPTLENTPLAVRCVSFCFLFSLHPSLFWQTCCMPPCLLYFVWPGRRIPADLPFCFSSKSVAEQEPSVPLYRGEERGTRGCMYQSLQYAAGWRTPGGLVLTLFFCMRLSICPTLLLFNQGQMVHLLNEGDRGTT